MADYPYLPLWTDAFLADTVHLDNRETGAYLLLLIASWRIGGPLPNDDTKLARYAKCSLKEWRRVSPAIMSFWALDETGQRVQKRLEIERRYVSDKSAKARSAAQAKWLKERQTTDAKASPKHMLNGHSADAPTPTPTPKEEITTTDRIERGASAPRAKEKNDGKYKLPPDWRPDAYCRDYASDRGLDPESTGDVFCDHFHNRKGKSERRDGPGWIKRWEIWCRADASRPVGQRKAGAVHAPRGNDAFYEQLALIASRDDKAD